MSVGVNLVGLRDTVKSRSSQVQSAESKYFKFEPLNKLTTWMLPTCSNEMSSLSLTSSDMMWTWHKNQRYTALLPTVLWLSSMHFHTNCICFRSTAAEKLNELPQYVEDNRMELIYTYLNTVLSNLKSRPSSTRLIWPPKESSLQCVYEQLASHLRAWDPSCSLSPFSKQTSVSLFCSSCGYSNGSISDDLTTHVPLVFVWSVRCITTPQRMIEW